MASYRQIFKSTGLLGSVQALYVLTAVLRGKVAALFIGAAGMGLVDLYQRMVELVGNFTNFGLGMSAVQQLSAVYARHEEQCVRISPLVRLIRTWVLITAVLGAVVSLLAAPVVSMLTTGDWSATAEYMLLSPVVACSTLTTGEAALLKATRHLKQLARASAYTAVCTLVVCTALYYVWGTWGILPMLIVTTAAAWVFNLRETLRFAPYRIGWMQRRYLRCGVPMLRLGTAFVVSGVATAGAEMLVRTVLVHSAAGLETVGLYAAGYALTAGYAHVMFVAVDADFFPRLSAAVHDVREANLTINRQINTLTVMVAPFMLLFALCLPLIVRVLYTEAFLAVVPMVICAAVHVYFRAIYIPVAYLSLAHGDSLVFMLMEMVYDVVFCACVSVGFAMGGLWGAGVGLSLAHLFDLLNVSLVYRLRYHYRMNRATLTSSLLLLLLLVVGLAFCFHPDVWVRVSVGAVCLALMCPVVYPVLKRTWCKP